MNLNEYSREASLRRREAEREASRRRRFACVIAVAMAGALAIGATAAFLFDTTTQVANTFTPAEVTTDIAEDFDGKVKENVAISNPAGDNAIDAYIRAKVVVAWQNEAGDVLPEAPEQVDAAADGAYGYAISGYPGSSKWVKGADGFWYHTTPVAPGTRTDELIGVISQVGKAPEEGYFLSVEILSQAIQAQPDAAVLDAWKTGVSAVDGNTGALTIKTGA